MIAHMPARPTARPTARITRTFATLLVAAGVLLSAPAVQAQPGGERGELAEGESMLPRLDFPGGTIEKFVSMLKDASRVPFNLIVHPSAAGATLPAMLIENSEPMSAVDAVQGLTFNRDGAEWMLELRLDRNPYGGVSSIQARRTQPHVVDAVINTSTEVLDLSSIVKPDAALGSGLRLEDVLAAVTTAVEQANANASQPPSAMTPPQPPQSASPRIALHRETNLLIVTGTPDQIRAAGQVVARLQERGRTWSKMSEVTIRTTPADREWLLTQLPVALRAIDAAEMDGSKTDENLMLVHVPEHAADAVRAIGSYLLSPEVRDQRSQRTIEAVVEQTRLQTMVRSLEAELRRSEQTLVEREAKLRGEIDGLLETVAKLSAERK